MTRRRWILLFAPFIATLLLAYGLSLTPSGSRIAVIRIELDTLLLLLGLIISLILGLIQITRIRNLLAVQQAAARAQAEAAEERRRFLRRLDHELKNPLTAIRAGFANLAAATGDERWAETRSSVESQILRLSRLTSDLRKLADLESRPLEERAAVDMQDLLRETFEAAQDRPNSGRRTLTLTMPQAPWPLPKVTGDRDLLFLAFFNLLDNALKFTEADDTVEMRAYEDGESVVVEVADTGIGIQEDEIRHVWEELYRGRDAHGVPGSGLGLSLVRAIVDRHGGSTELRSKPQHGTVISIRLPAAR